MGLIGFFAAAAALYMLYNVFKIFRQYQKACKTGFKVYVHVFDTTNPFWTLFATPLLPVLRRILPASAVRVVELTAYGFEWRDKVAGRTRFRPGYMIASPGYELDLFVEDPEIAGVILTRWREFPMDRMSKKFMGAVGPNMTSSDGKDWQRQRRLIAPMLNERIMDTVWNESVEQAGDMMEAFMGQDGGQTDRTVEGVRRIAFNVLQCIGYGMPQGWNEPDPAPSKGHKMTYSQAIAELIEGLVLVAMIPAKLLAKPWLPDGIRRKGEAIFDFRKYTKELLAMERELSKTSQEPRNSMLNMLANISERNAESKENDSSLPKNSLSDAEIEGNLYQFTLAGYDTTANTMAYAFVMLAAQPEWQDWIVEEIDHVSAAAPGLSYREVFPKLGRVLALMHETLRIYTPVGHICRACPTDQTMVIDGKTYTIPADTRCTISLDGIGSQPGCWGSDASKFLPTRWLLDASEVEKDSSAEAPKSTSTTGIAATPNLRQPAKGAFLPWSGGPRQCPGMKMAQVEFMAVVYSVFRQHRVEAVQKPGESAFDARRRLRDVTNDSHPHVTLQMNHPRDVVLKWVKR